MICKKCGKENLNDMLFCGYCGSKLSADAAGKKTGSKPAPRRKSSSMLTSFIVLFMAVAAVWFYNHKDNLTFLKKDTGENTEMTATGDMLPIEETVALANAEVESDQSTAEGAFRMYYDAYNAGNADIVFATSVGPYAPESKEEAKTKEALQSRMNASNEKNVLKETESGYVYTEQEVEKIAAYLEENYGYTFAAHPLQAVTCLQTTEMKEEEKSEEVVMLKVGDKWYYDKNIEPEQLSEIL